MAAQQQPPIGVSLSADVEFREDRPAPYKARVRWVDPPTGRRRSLSTSVVEPEQAQDWIDGMHRAARGGVDPMAATMNLADYGKDVMDLAVRGLERKTLDPYLAGWKNEWFPRSGIYRCG